MGEEPKPALVSEPPPADPDPGAPAAGAASPIFGWPTAVLLLGLVAMTFTFAFLLVSAGQDLRTAVAATLVLLAGTAMVVVPAGAGSLMRRLGGALAGAFHGWRK
jgi:hypothetical protein